MKKSLVLFLVATLLLAGCTELTSDDGETTVEMNEEIALEKITEIVDPSDDSSWGMTYIMEMDMGSLMGSMGDMDSEEDSDEVETSYSVTMTQAMSPNGAHMSQVIKMTSEDTMGEEIEIIQSWTQSGNTIYLETGYTMPADSDMSADELAMYESMMGTKEYNMKSELTHTQAMELMSSESDDEGPLAILSMMMYIESYGTFTPMPSEDGLTMYKVVLDMEAMEDGSPTPEMILTMCDSNNDDSLSWEEFNSEECRPSDEETELYTEFRSYFDEADSNSDGLLDKGELSLFIENVDKLHDSMDEEEDHDHDDRSGDDHSDHEDHSGDDHGDHDDDMQQEDMEFEFAFNSKGDVEFFRMDTGDSIMTVYMLSDSKVESLTSSSNDGGAVALPFVIGDSYMDDDDEYPEPSNERFLCNNGQEIPADFVNDGDNDCGDWSDEPNHDNGGDAFTYECVQFIESSFMNENSTFNMTYDDTNLDSLMCGEVVSEDMQTHDWTTGEHTMPTNFSYLDCDGEDGNSDCSMGVMSVVVNTVGDSELYDTSEEMTVDESECEGVYDGNNETCQVFVGIIVNSDDMAIEIDSQRNDRTVLIYYQYDAGSGSGLIMVASYGDEDHEDHSGDGHEDHSGDRGDDTLYVSIGEAMIPFEGDMNDYSIVLATCEDSYDADTGMETKICDNEMTVSMADAMKDGSSIMFHDTDSSGTISDGDMIHISETVDVDYEEVRLYSSSADAYSDENPVFSMPGFTGVVGVLALLGAALLRRKA